MTDGGPTFSHFPAAPPPVPLRLTTLMPQPCAYLPDRAATVRAFRTDAIDDATYGGFLDASFRRSGDLFYQPVCATCRQCRPIRVPTDRFAPSRSQRRAWMRNDDLAITADDPEPTQEKFDLYARYTREWHGRTDDVDYDGFVEFLYHSPARTIEFCYRDPAGRLLGVGLCDLTADVLSSGYFYYAPDAADRSLGTYSAVREIDFARRVNRPYYHLGYWVRDCPAMAYKANFQPAETLDGDGVWRPLTAADRRR